MMAINCGADQLGLVADSSDSGERSTSARLPPSRAMKRDSPADTCAAPVTMAICRREASRVARHRRPPCARPVQMW
jgi:hypothetical protein